MMIASLIGRPERNARTIRSIASANRPIKPPTHRLPTRPLTIFAIPNPTPSPPRTTARPLTLHRAGGPLRPGRDTQTDRQRRVGSRIHHGQRRSDPPEQGAVQAEIFGPRQKSRPYAARREGTAQLAVGAFSLELIGEQLL